MLRYLVPLSLCIAWFPAQAADPALIGTWSAKIDDRGRVGFMIFDFLDDGRFVQHWLPVHASSQATGITYFGRYSIEGHTLQFTAEQWANGSRGERLITLQTPPDGYIGATNIEVVEFKGKDRLVFHDIVWQRED